MNLVADMGGIVIVPDVTTDCASVKIINMGDIGPLGDKSDIGHLSSVRGPASLFTFSHALKTFILDVVVTRFRLTLGSMPRLEMVIFNTKPISEY